MSANIFSQQKITGTIYDEAGETIIGASIVVKGTSKGTVSDHEGKFSLEISEKSSLVITYLGYLQQEMAIGDQKNLTIKLREDAKNLDEVIVVGYGTQKKANLTGSVAAINSSMIESRPATNTSTALQGLMPGVTVIQNGGQPGKDDSSIRIRGVGTISNSDNPNNANPMYVVDGLTVSTINDIDPNDIENISVLKDAASAAIYGSRAANGVILITTKKGSNKPATVKYDAYFGVQSPTALPEYLPSHEYAHLYNNARLAENKQLAYTADEIEKFRNGSDPDNYPNTDWLDLFYKNGLQHSHRAEVSGGSEKTTYMFSLGYLSQDGVIDIANFKRYNARANISTQIKRASINFNLSHTYGNTIEPVGIIGGDMYQIFRQIGRIAPFVPYKYSNGYYGYMNDGNPLAWMDSEMKRQEQYRTTRGVASVSYELLEGLKIQEVIGYEYTAKADEKFVKDIQFYNWKTGAPTLYQGPNSQTDRREDAVMLNLQTLLTYNRRFDKHTVGGILGYSQEYSRTDWTKGYRKDFLNNDLWELNAGSPSGQEANGGAEEYALQSFFGRASYGYDDKYLFEANVRRDGTSRIIDSQRWGTFPSFSAAWRISSEPFWESLSSVISDAKIRASWGKLGNQQIGNYPYQSSLTQKNYTFGGSVQQGLALEDGSNRFIKWETSKTTNIGADFAFLANKLSMAIDVYERNTEDVLMKLPVSTLYGLKAPYQNAAKINNKGV
ncbi:hypothetical protein AwDysgo_11150 [Bacteroidales bacterium]|nr:hypothetical protein AwDysgo_11150 [Bacteroidales bacterium]